MGTQALIAYVDQSDKSKVPELIPCRFSTVVDVQSHGTTASLLLILNEFAFAENLNVFRKELEAASAGILPSWNKEQSIAGFYWIDLGQEPRTVVKTTNLADWEKIVEQIAVRADFQGEGCFYTMKLVTLHNTKPTVLIPKQGMYNLSSGRQYEFHIYHFHPIAVPPGTALNFTLASDWLKLVTNTSIPFDSRYDLKRARLKTGTLLRESSRL
jgi:hypothetical protein